MTPAALASSRAYCHRLTRRANSSFPVAFRLLPPDKRAATFALYAFFRATDDLADGPGDPTAKRTALGAWRAGLRAALDGAYSHRVHAAVHHAVGTFGVPPDTLEAVINGAGADLDPVRFATFDDLVPYCRRVASAVGVACVHVWGFRTPADRPAAVALADAAGIAFQLTNILRDLGEDQDRGRVYLPADELARFGCPPDRWQDPARAGEFRAMMRFQADRAENFYRRAEPLGGLLSADGRAVYGVMAGVYRRLLAEIVRRDFDVFSGRVRVGKLVKARLLLSAWPAKWGLV